MSKALKQDREGKVEMHGVERLALRVSSMINHPIAQLQRWVTIHQLDTDGDREWEEVMGVLAETAELDITLNDEGSVTVRWEPLSEQDRPLDAAVDGSEEEPAPF